MKQPIRSRRNNRRGVTMVEVVVALIMISVVSAAALTMVMMSISVEQKAVTSLSVKTDAENVLNCFRYAETEEEFLEALKKTGAYEKDAEGHFVLSAEEFSVIVSADFSADSFVYTATNPDGEIIYTFTYPRSLEEGGGSA